MLTTPSFRPRCRTAARGCALLLALAPGLVAPGARAGGLRSVVCSFHTYAAGEQEFVCLLLDGRLLPLSPPPGVRAVGAGDSVSLGWPDERTVVRFRAADSRESALLVGEGPGGAAAEDWLRLARAGLAPGSGEPSSREVVPNVLPVNGWRTGAVALAYELGGQRFGRFLVLCRCRDGFVLAASLDAPAEQFTARRVELLGMLGGSLLTAN